MVVKYAGAQTLVRRASSPPAATAFESHIHRDMTRVANQHLQTICRRKAGHIDPHIL
jgi:hypothetical protein